MTDESTIVQRVLDGDTECFRLLVERYQRPVLRMICHTMGVTQGAEDLAQDVFLNAFAKLRTFDPSRSRFSTWLLTIARNKSINQLKKKRPEVLAEPPEPMDCVGPLENATRQEAFARLDRALLALPGRQRRALAMVEFEGLSYDEAAQIEGTRPGTVKSRVSRARARLAELLRVYEEDDA